MNLFRRKPKSFGENRWVVKLLGGPGVVSGKPVAGFIAYRTVEATDAAGAEEAGRAMIIGEFRQTGVKCDESEIKVASYFPLNPSVKAKKPETHFWTEESLPKRDFDELERWLRQHNLWVERDDLKIIVRNNIQDMLDVEIEYGELEFTVTCGPWHGHFDEMDQADACFRWLLTPYYRVVHETKDGERVGAWIERWGRDGWEVLSPLLGLKTVALIDAGGPYDLEVTQQAQMTPGDYAQTVRGVVLDQDGMPPGSFIGTRRQRTSRSQVANWEVIKVMRKHQGKFPVGREIE